MLGGHKVRLIQSNRTAILAVPQVGELVRQQICIRDADVAGRRKTFAAFLRGADESTLGRAVVEAVILLTASRGSASRTLRDEATAHKVDTDAIAAKVKQEFAAKRKAKMETKPAPKVPVKAQPKTAKKAAAA